MTRTDPTRSGSVPSSATAIEELHLPKPGVEESAPPMPAPPSTQEDPFLFLKALAEISALFVALTFIGGWSYLASYYRTFGLNYFELDVSVQVVCALAIYVLYNAKWPLIVFAAMIILQLIFARQLRNQGRRATAASLGLLLLTSAVAGLFRGRQLANEDALLNSYALPYVAFATKLERADLPPCVEFKTYGSLDCKLLLHSKGVYYFFQPVPKAGEGMLKVVGSINLYTLSDSDVIGLHVQRGLDRNARIE